ADAVPDPLAADGALHDQAVVAGDDRGTGAEVADVDRGRAGDRNHRGGAVGGQAGGGLDAVDGPIPVRVGHGVGRVGAERRPADEHALLHVALDLQGRAALLQVGGRLLDVGQDLPGLARGDRVAGGADGAVDAQGAVDRRLGQHADAVLTLHRDGAGDVQVAADDVAGGGGADAVAVVPGDGERSAGDHGLRQGARAGRNAGHGVLDQDAGRVVALDGDGAAVVDLPRQRPGHVDADAVGALGERRFGDAVAVDAVAGGVALAEADRAAVHDVPVDRPLDQDPRRVADVVGGDGPGAVGDGVVAVQRDRGRAVLDGEGAT